MEIAVGDYFKADTTNVFVSFGLKVDTYLIIIL